MKQKFSSISAVVPVYNEADVIGELYRRLTETLRAAGLRYEIVFVDDGSRDGSLDQLKEIQSRDASVVVLELMRNFGQTAALAAGIDHAQGELIITMDGDLQHDPAEIPEFLRKIEEGYDVVSGCRAVRRDNAFTRRFPSFCANYLMRLLSGVNVRDFGSTYKVYRAELIKQVELFGELHRFIPVLAHRIGARICEIPIQVKPRPAGKSNYGLSRTFGVFQDILFLEFYSNYLTKPIRAFGKLAFLFFGSGFLISFVLMLLWCLSAIATVRDHSGLLLLSVFLMIVGVQFLVAGIFAELLTRIYLRTSNSRIYSLRAVHQQTGVRK